MVAIALTFDNLGEATALERGTWDGTTPLGDDPSVTVALPRLLDELAARDLTGTFCVESLNCGLNPRAVRAVADRGHEVAAHGWRHEAWARLEPDHERELLRRSLEAFAGLGIRPAGFRPPGGDPARADPQLLREAGFTWWSPAADEHAAASQMSVNDITTVPFTWDWVDAYLLMESFTDLRAERGDPATGLDAESAGRWLRDRITAATGAHTIVMHPFLMLDEAWWAQTRRLLALLADRVEAGELVCVTGTQAAAAVRPAA